MPRSKHEHTRPGGCIETADRPTHSQQSRDCPHRHKPPHTRMTSVQRRAGHRRNRAHPDACCGHTPRHHGPAPVIAGAGAVAAECGFAHRAPFSHRRRAPLRHHRRPALPPAGVCAPSKVIAVHIYHVSYRKRQQRLAALRDGLHRPPPGIRLCDTQGFLPSCFRSNCILLSPCPPTQAHPPRQIHSINGRMKQAVLTAGGQWAQLRWQGPTSAGAVGSTPPQRPWRGRPDAATDTLLRCRGGLLRRTMKSQHPSIPSPPGRPIEQHMACL